VTDFAYYGKCRACRETGELGSGFRLHHHVDVLDEHLRVERPLLEAHRCYCVAEHREKKQFIMCKSCKGGLGLEPLSNL